MVEATWPRDRFGVDLSRAIPNSVQNVKGTSVQTASLIQLPFTGVATPTAVLVTGASATIDAETTLVVVKRVAPVSTILNLPPVANQTLPITIIDWSSSVTEHTITLTPDGGELILRGATYPMVSNTVQLTSGILVPINSLVPGGWGFIA